jgi:MFS family permease
MEDPKIIESRQKTLKYVLYLSALVYFGQGIESLPYQPFKFYLKNLGWTPSKVMFVGSLLTLAWLIKPVIGYLVDRFASKKLWVLSSALTSCVISCLIGTINLPLGLILLLMGVANWNAAVRDVAVDGLMCVTGKESQATGAIQSAQWIAVTFAGVLVGFSGGWIADHLTFKNAFLILAPFYLLLCFYILKFGKEKPKEVLPTLSKYKELFTNKRFLGACLFLFLYMFSPSFGTPLYYIETDKFKWSQTFIGTIASIGAICSIIGAVIYYKISKIINVKKWLVTSVFIGACTSLAYLYFTPVTDIAYAIIFGLVGMIIHLIAMDWMARTTLPGIEATSFALLCSISNLAGTVSTWTGAWLLPIVGLQPLIILSAVTSFACLPLIKFINKEEPK